MNKRMFKKHADWYARRFNVFENDGYIVLRGRDALKFMQEMFSRDDNPYMYWLSAPLRVAPNRFYIIEPGDGAECHLVHNNRVEPAYKRARKWLERPAPRRRFADDEVA